jgi:hypothetical protein
MQRIPRQFLALLRATDGMALMEFMFMLPFLMIMLFGALEIGRAMVITQRTEKATYAIADITSQYSPATVVRSPGELSETELQQNVYPQFSRIMGSYADTASQRVILTSVRKEGGIIRIKWQSAGGGMLSREVTSVVNGLGPDGINAGVRNQPASFAPEVDAQLAGMENDENMVVAEIFYYYNPVWNQALHAIRTIHTSQSATITSPHLLAKRMYFRPRNGDLTCLPDTFVYPVTPDDPTGC